MSNWYHKIEPHKSNHCKACGLYLNQLPLSDNKRHADVFWVGLSAVQINDDLEKSIPLSPSTRSGKLIYDIEKKCSDTTSFYKTNLVKCLPLNEHKIRYPELLEMEKCFPNLISELSLLKPKVVFLLGKQVSTFVLKKFNLQSQKYDADYRYKSYTIDGTSFIPIHHPSFILVYRRKMVNTYIDSICSIIKSNAIMDVA